MEEDDFPILKIKIDNEKEEEAILIKDIYKYLNAIKKEVNYIG
jgi:hypothetical protein